MEGVIYDSKIEYLQVMDADGNVDQALFPKDLKDEDILEMYRKMMLARAIDAKVLSLQRQGRAVTYAPLLGEEATQIGSASAMRSNDIFVPSFRQHGVFAARGMPLETMFIYWRGFEEGNIIPKGVNATPTIVPVATQLPHAAGMAFAQKYKNTGAYVIVYVGDGGTSEGDFYEGLNFAGAFGLPMVVIIENNQWAISMPRRKQTAAATLAQKADAAGIAAMQVDGNDVIAVYKATREAINSGKPFVIECITYRMGLHTTSDDPGKYREDAEVKEWERRDPLARVSKYLTGKTILNPEIEKKIREDQAREIDSAVEKAEKFVPDPRSMYTNVYGSMPRVLEEELDEAERNGFWSGDLK